MSVKTDAEQIHATHEQPDVAVARFYRPKGYQDFSQPFHPAGVPGRLEKTTKAIKQISDGE